MERGVNIIEMWDQIAPLSERQLNFIDKLDALANPFKGLDDEEPKKEVIKETKKETKEEIDFAKVDNLYDFEQLLIGLEDDISRNADKRFEKLRDGYSQCQTLVNDLTTILNNLETLQKQYKIVSSKTGSLHNTCESLLQQQHSLIVAGETINERLTYFKELEPMSKKLNAPTMLILNESLMPMLARLDACISYLRSKPNYKESGSYLAQFCHLQSQALSTIKIHVINTLQQASQQVMPDSKEGLSPSDSVFTLFYGKFQTNAHRVKSLMSQIEERIDQSDTYKQFLTECHQNYFQVRETLIGPVLSMAIDDMVNSHQRHYCTLLRTSTTMLIHICRDEYQLFFQFFSQTCLELNEFLEKLCFRLNDVLRPIVIHINHLETLSEICAIIKETIEEQGGQTELEAFLNAMRQLLQDCQERLVYRTNIYIQTNIVGYCPASGDLAYPEKLEMMESIAETLAQQQQQQQQQQLPQQRAYSRSNSVCSVASDLSDISFATTDAESKSRPKQRNYSPADLHGMWYPTVRRTIMCLSKLFRSLDKSTFQGLSQEVLASCIESLDIAKGLIIKRKSVIDGQLFLLKHLLIIREQIAPFNIENTLKEVSIDFSRTKIAAFDLLQTRENLFSLTTNNALLKFFVEGAPQVIEEVIDSQKAVDVKIKITCEQFISNVTQMLLSQMIQFSNLCKSVDQTTPLKSQTFASPEIVSTTVTDAVAQLKNGLPIVKRSMSIYLANKDTESILFRPIKTNIEKNSEQLCNFIQSTYTPEEQTIIGCPSLQELIALCD